MDKCGALWLTKSKDGKTTYMSGTIEINGVKKRIAVFKNGFKTEEKHPDYTISFSGDKKDTAGKVSDVFGGDVPF